MYLNDKAKKAKKAKNPSTRAVLTIMASFLCSERVRSDGIPPALLTRTFKRGFVATNSLANASTYRSTPRKLKRGGRQQTCMHLKKIDHNANLIDRFHSTAEHSTVQASRERNRDILIFARGKV